MMSKTLRRIRVIDSHTGGEPTRVVIDGFPDLGNGTVDEKLDIFRERHDRLRSAIVREPRGHEALVGAILCEPSDTSCAAAVIFFNNVGYLNMCGHGMIGVVRTLEFLGRITLGNHRIETPAGIVEVRLGQDGTVAIDNVPSYRWAKDVAVVVGHHGTITGDIAWGGNWFFLIEDDSLEIDPENIEALTELAWRVREALCQNGITGKGGNEIDHIEIFSKTENADSRNFVLCPGREYDRSPCGTGTSAKLACLYEDGKLKPGEIWRQKSIIGSVFEGRVRIDNGKIIPTISGSAYITGENDLIFDDEDPFRYGLAVQAD